MARSTNDHTVRHVRGPQILLRCKVESATVIKRGDLLYFYTSSNVRYVKPASSFTWDTNILTTQKAFKLVFAGVAQDGSDALQTKDIVVDGSPHAQFRFDCAAAMFTQGACVAPAKQSGADLLMDQTVVAVSGQADACIARVAENYRSANVTKVVVTNLASIMYDDLSDATSGQS